MNKMYDKELLENIECAKFYKPYICFECHLPTLIERSRSFECWNHNCNLIYEFLEWTVRELSKFKISLIKAYK